MKYTDCSILCNLERKDEPVFSEVPIDNFTAMVEKNFDYEFTGKTCVFPFKLPLLPENFGILCIVGASGSGKSTLIKEFDEKYKIQKNKYDDRAIVSNFPTPEIAATKLSAVGLNSLPTWCKPRKVLSTGEGFRADLALNLDSYTIFDEFTSVIDRNVAKSTCNSVQKYIRQNSLTNIVLVSCHKDFIPFLKPDLVIDTDEEKIYDCRGKDLGETLPCKSMKPKPKICGVYLGDIII